MFMRVNSKWPTKRWESLTALRGEPTLTDRGSDCDVSLAMPVRSTAIGRVGTRPA